LTFTYHLNYSPATSAASASPATLALTRAPDTKEEEIPQKERLHLADHGMTICNEIGPFPIYWTRNIVASLNIRHAATTSESGEM